MYKIVMGRVEMHLKQTRQKNGRVNLSIVEGWWDPKLKRSRQKTIKTLGYVDVLEQTHEDPISWGKSLAREMTEEKRAGEAENIISLDINLAKRIDLSTTSEKNLGSVIALSQYAALGIEQTLRSATRNSKAKYDLNAVARLLVCERIIDPGSKLSAWDNRERYFFRSAFTKTDMYRALDVLADNKNKVISAMNRKIASAGVRDMEAVFYDVTNYYFEIDKEDDLRRRGVSKEHRKSPIVQMGLLQDVDWLSIFRQIF